MQCQMCQYEVANTVELLLEHISRAHSNSSNFQITCIVTGCQRTYRNHASFRRHLREAHKYYTRQQSDIDQTPSTSHEDQLTNDNNSEDTYDVGPPIKKQRAEWILKVKETNKLTQVCTENILSDVTNLCSSVINDLTAAVKQKLISHNATPELHQDIMNILTTPNFSKPFEGLETSYKQMQYLRQHFNYVVSYRLTFIFSMTCMYVTQVLNDCNDCYSELTPYTALTNSSFHDMYQCQGHTD